MLVVTVLVTARHIISIMIRWLSMDEAMVSRLKAKLFEC